MDGIADWRKRRNGRWSQKKVKRKQIWNSQLGRNVNKKKENRNNRLVRNINQWKTKIETNTEKVKLFGLDSYSGY